MVICIIMKYKTIKIEEDKYKTITDFCKEENLKISSWSQSVLIKTIYLWNRGVFDEAMKLRAKPNDK